MGFLLVYVLKLLLLKSPDTIGRNYLNQIMNKTKTPYQKYQSKKAKLDAEIKLVEDNCTHPKEYLNKKYRRGGEFDNEFKIDITCLYCGKFWVEDQ